VINAAFQVGLAVLNLLRRLLIAVFLTVSDYGLWGIIVASLVTLMWFKEIGITDKYIQQSDPDQELAFQKAFTLNLYYTSLFFLLAAAAIPVFAAIYGQPRMIVPGLLISLTIIGSALQTPTWVFYRQMDFVRQRTLSSIDPVTAFVVTMSLGAAGAGIWSLVIGAVAGSWLGALAAVRACPYRIALRFDRAVVRDYFSFSWPLVTASASGLVVVQASMIVGEATVGLAGVGVIGLAGAIATFADRVDGIITRTIYPAVCAVRDRKDLLQESFTKSNRLALMWAMPFGVGLTLFAPDFVTYVLGDRWRSATGLLQAFGLMMAVKQIGFNWTAFARANNETRPLAVNGLLGMATFLAVGVPLMITIGVTGYAIGMGAITVVQLVNRTLYLRRLFSGFEMLKHSVRAIVPSVPPALAVLALRPLEDGRPPEIVVGELALYAGLTVAMTVAFERALLREVIGYLRPRPERLAAA
jgi:O-antigen/teichoic acid export membrane protein